MKKVGLVTTSQTPRIDVVPSLRGMISRSVEFVEVGALDDLTREEILKLTPRNDADVLVSRARDGSEIVFGKRYVVPRLQKCIDALNSEGVEAIALLCAGSFPKFESNAPVVRPDLLMYGFLKSIPNLRKVGLMVPNEKQQGPIGKEFGEEGFKVVTSWLSPYREGSLRDAVRPFMREDVTLTSLLCMGYGPELKQKVTMLTLKSAVLSQSLLAKAIDELLV